MKNPENIRQLIELPIDMLGLIFYDKSPRFAGNLAPEALEPIPENIKKVGVFVNASKDYILATAKRYGLDMLQLHGSESPEFCRDLRAAGCEIIKTFSVSETNDLKRCSLYESACDFFLFDTKTPAFGGSGRKFDWQILSEYKGAKPFFLSGGIGEEVFDSESLKSSVDTVLPYALDLNSRFEIEPGLKDIEKLRKVLSKF